MPDRAAVEAYLRAAASLDPDTYAAVWTEDGTLEMPYHPDPAARVTVGRAAIRARMTTAADVLAKLEWVDPVIRATEEPGVYVVEMSSEAKRVNGDPYRNTYVIVARVVDGKIALWREYFDPTPFRAGEP